MNNLPSRERVSEAITFAHITDVDGDCMQDVAQAYVEGRLVDRDTFNYLAAAAEAGWHINVNLYPDSSSHITDAAIAIVDAAIGDTG